MRGGSLLLFFALVLFFPSPPIRSGEAFSSVIFSSLYLLLFAFFGCSDGMEREACVYDHGFERSDLCAEIITIIRIIITYVHALLGQSLGRTFIVLSFIFTEPVSSTLVSRCLSTPDIVFPPIMSRY